MKIAVSATDNSMDAAVDPRFGRCAYLLIVDSETSDIVGGGKNEFATAGGGAGTQTAQSAIRQGAQVVVTGNIGPNAYNVLQAGKLKVYSGVSGSVREAIARLNKGELRQTPGSTVPPHSGMR
jgi:predicted Fe-Mo cluster-binding NifX family protein